MPPDVRYLSLGALSARCYDFRGMDRLDYKIQCWRQPKGPKCKKQKMAGQGMSAAVQAEGRTERKTF